MTNEELAVRIQAGEKNLMRELWEQNTGFFRMAAGRLYFAHQRKCNAAHVELDDVFQTSYFVLCAAVKAYKPDSGYKLITYTNFHLRNHFWALLGGRTSKRDALNYALSLDKALTDETDASLIDLIEAPDGEAPFEAVDDDIFRADLRGGLEAALSNLPQNQSEVIRSRYFDGKTKRRTAIEMGETEGQVGCAERNALQKMRSDYRLRTFSDTILDKTAYRGTGLGAFREDRASSVEMAVMAVERLNEQISNCRIGGQDDGRIGGNEYGSI